MENLIIENKVYKSLHDIFTWETNRVKIDYEKKEVLIDLSWLGNEVSYNLLKLFENFSDVKNEGFNVSFYVRDRLLNHYFTSKTCSSSVKSLFIGKIFPNYKFYSLKDSHGGIRYLIPFNEKSIELIELEHREENRYKNFIKTILKEGRIPKIKAFKIFVPKNKSLDLLDSIKTLRKIGIENFKKFFVLKDYSNQTYYLERSFNNLPTDFSLTDYNNLLAIGLNPNYIHESIEKVKNLNIFNEIGA